MTRNLMRFECLQAGNGKHGGCCIRGPLSWSGGCCTLSGYQQSIHSHSRSAHIQCLLCEGVHGFQAGCSSGKRAHAHAHIQRRPQYMLHWKLATNLRWMLPKAAHAWIAHRPLNIGHALHQPRRGQCIFLHTRSLLRGMQTPLKASIHAVWGAANAQRPNC
jgi:hypothetical protein